MFKIMNEWNISSLYIHRKHRLSEKIENLYSKKNWSLFLKHPKNLKNLKAKGLYKYGI